MISGVVLKRIRVDHFNYLGAGWKLVLKDLNDKTYFSYYYSNQSVEDQNDIAILLCTLVHRALQCGVRQRYRGDQIYISIVRFAL